MFSREFNSTLLHVHWLEKCIDENENFDFCCGGNRAEAEKFYKTSEQETKLLHVHCMGECIDKTTSDVEELKNNSEKETSDFTDQNSTSDVLNIESHYSRCMDKKFLGCKWGGNGQE